MQEQGYEKSIYEQDLERLEKLRLMDDDFFSEALNEKTEAVSYILRTILQREDIKIKETKAQAEYKSATRRSIKLDIKAVTEDGKVMDIEIQRSDHGTGEKRARFHSSMIDRSLLFKGDDFTKLPDTYVIFITEKDKFGRKIPLYHVDRTIKEMGNFPFGDGSHIIYVNGEFQNKDHPVGRLMYDFHCKNASEMLNPILAKEVKYLKESEDGRGHMCRLLEEMREETAAKVTHEQSVKFAERLLAKNRYSLEEIAELTDLPVEEVRKLAEKQTA